MKYSTLGFTLFRKCNAQCEVCCFESSPTCKEALDVEKIKTFIDSAVGAPDLQTISFTGGEPFLEYETLLDLVAYAVQKGFPASAITNCFWASSEAIALEKIGRLKQAGLSRMSVSYDEFHAAFIPAANVANVLTACKRLRIPVTIGVMKRNGSDVGAQINALGDAALNCGIMTYPVLPSGGAAKTFSPEEFIRQPLEKFNLLCQYDGNIVVRYDGKIHPCCNQCVVETELIVGNYETDTYPEVLKRTKNNGILFLLRTEGLYPFFAYAKDVLHMELPEQIVSPCELCARFFSKENIDCFYPLVKERIEQKLHPQSAT